MLSPLCHSLLPQNNFERNMTDIFMVKAKDVGELTRIVVGVRGAGDLLLFTPYSRDAC